MPKGEIVEINYMARKVFEDLLIANHSAINPALSLAFNSTDLDVPDILFKWNNYFIGKLNSAIFNQ